MKTRLREALAVFALFVSWGALAEGPCGDGWTLIGEDKDNYYCSKLKCESLPAQVERDAAAVLRQQRTNIANSKELKAWQAENEAAQAEAAKHLAGAILEGFSMLGEHVFSERLEEAAQSLARRGVDGETWARKIERMREFDKAFRRLDALASGFKIGGNLGMPAIELWDTLRARSREALRQANHVSERYEELNREPGIRQALLESRANLTIGALKLALGPPADAAISSLQLMVDFGYDYTVHAASLERIAQAAGNSRLGLRAICVVQRQYQITQRNLNICAGHLPPAGTPNPEEIACPDDR